MEGFALPADGGPAFSCLFHFFCGTLNLSMWKPVQSVPSNGIVRVLGPALPVLASVAASKPNLLWRNPSGGASTRKPVVGSETVDPGASAQNSAPSSTQPATNTTRPLHYSHRQLQTLLRNARTGEDHEQLADHFRAREREFRAREAYEQQALTEYLKDPARYSSKYPTRGDTAREMASYYHLKAQKSATLALEHARRATDLRTKK